MVQTQGRKHWRVYRPPPYKAGAEPLWRGKGGDTISEEELELLIDVVLSPGEILHVPLGFPHLTDTKEMENEEAHSIHLSVQWAAHSWHLDYVDLRNAVLIAAGLDETLDLGQVPYDALWGNVSSEIGQMERPGLMGVLQKEASEWLQTLFFAWTPPSLAVGISTVWS
eukprot:gnl/MRDRNA2_/MRDRNA2_51921_c0_seq1.p1 gnl/MRDRNA2_/MRDRNA2_51921_c0~~gnl/MRDRNA2_/MRDRNA2_51921_c0_seq1.p1  ORF type:complete len:194 (+),score=26.71 gnl/MRDRNA2_/MRDRNA2_51921_c0_seq1:79-582(+)